MYEDKILEAVQFVSDKHKDQKRKIFNYPYISHPLMVYHMVSLYTDDINVHLAALLHDTVEDTETNIKEVENLFGSVVAAYVAGLSENKDLDWLERKEQYRLQLSKESHEVLLIKAADLIYNLQDSLYILRNYPLEEFNALYFRKEWIDVQTLLIETIKQSWDENPLIDKVSKIFETLINEYHTKKHV